MDWDNGHPVRCRDPHWDNGHPVRCHRADKYLLSVFLVRQPGFHEFHTRGNGRGRPLSQSRACNGRGRPLSQLRR